MNEKGLNQTRKHMSAIKYKIKVIAGKAITCIYSATHKRYTLSDTLIIWLQSS